LAQTVWPGDVNNNGIVNEVDLLYLGYAFNTIGPPRATINDNWAAQDIVTTWDGSFPDGLNFAYADCNGDGIVNETDADVIQARLTLMHDDVPFIQDEILLPTSNLGAKFSIDDSNLSVASGQTIDLRIDFDNSDQELDNINILGFAFTVSVDTQFFETSETVFNELLVSWINTNGETTNRRFSNPTDGKFTVAYAKIDREAILNPTGAIGTFSFVIEDNIINFLEPTDTVRVIVDSITVVTDELEKIPIGGSSVDLDIIGRTTSTYNPILDKIKFYPNPTNGWLLLKSEEVFLERVELVNTLGQIVYHKQLNNTTFQSLDLQHIPEGMYWLRMITELGIKSTPIQRL